MLWTADSENSKQNEKVFLSQPIWVFFFPLHIISVGFGDFGRGRTKKPSLYFRKLCIFASLSPSAANKTI